MVDSAFTKGFRSLVEAEVVFWTWISTGEVRLVEIDYLIAAFSDQYRRSVILYLYDLPAGCDSPLSKDLSTVYDEPFWFRLSPNNR